MNETDKVLPLPGAAPPPGSEPEIEVSSELAAFLTTLKALDDRYFIERVPGLGGGWQAGWVRKGLAMKAIRVHWTGSILCLTRGPQADELFRQMRWADCHSPRLQRQYEPGQAAREVAKARAEARRTELVPALDEF